MFHIQHVHSILIDHCDGIWLGTQPYGLFKGDLAYNVYSYDFSESGPYPLTNNNIRGITVHDQYIGFYTDLQTVSILNKETQRLSSFNLYNFSQHEPITTYNTRTQHKINDIHFQNNIVWIARYDGLIKLDPERNIKNKKCYRG